MVAWLSRQLEVLLLPTLHDDHVKDSGPSPIQGDPVTAIDEEADTDG
jgi:hypothetical protein